MNEILNILNGGKGNFISATNQNKIHFIWDIDGTIKDDPNGNGKFLIPEKRLAKIFRKMLENGHYVSICTHSTKSYTNTMLKEIGLTEDEISKIKVSTHNVTGNKNNNIARVKAKHVITNEEIVTVFLDDRIRNIVAAVKEFKVIPIIPAHVIKTTFGIKMGVDYDTTHFYAVDEILKAPENVVKIAEKRSLDKKYYKQLHRNTFKDSLAKNI